MGSSHVPVMQEECVKHFSDSFMEVFFDGTLGAGGHARAILESHPEIKKYIGCDQDPEALELARKHLEPWKHKIKFINGNFSDLDKHLLKLGISKADGFFLI
jgi:16S rRNA (cytosine1402-N4)-methyltransferase